MNTSNVLDLRSAGYGYLYWLVFLVALEPGNVLRAYNRGFWIHLSAAIWSSNP